MSHSKIVIQLMALATPLFIQVVIDKVIVHHSMNTLYAIGFGLLMFMVFSAIMTWVRQYLVLHTGNRVDAVLGSRVFNQLFNLPLRYFEHRPTGTLVARVQGIETIREFVSGAAVSLMLDLPFLFIFLGIMFYYSVTLTKLLQGFYPATEGQLKIDGRDICHLSANELRANFGIVPQETMLFSGTIYDNLILANPHATFEQVIQACKMADIHTTIEQMPKAYQQEIGEHGAGLSGGQKQRLAIARALLKRPKILIFDEATSSLDSQTANNIAQTINQLKGKGSY